MKKKIITTIQLAIAVALLGTLFYTMDEKRELLTSLQTIIANWPYLIGALAAVFVCLILCAIRWSLLLMSHNIDLPVWQMIELYFIGHFFNAFMLGSVGGDLVKAFFVAKAVPQKKTEAVATIFLDRVIGLVALVALGTVVVLFRFRFFAKYPETRVAMITIVLAFVGSVVGLTVVFSKNVFERWPLFRRIEERTSLGPMIAKVYNAFSVCFTHKGLLVKTFTLSVANHLALVTCAFLLGLGLTIRTVHTDPPQDESLPLSTMTIVQEYGNYLTLFPLINGIASIPATPGGLGSREVATKFLMGVPEFRVPETKSVPLSLLLYSSMLFWSLSGGAVYITYAVRQGRVSKTELESLNT